jgi:lipid A disaccharide synthetase
MMFGKQAKYFRKAGGHVVEVGHPLLDLVEYKITRQQVYCLLACL